MRTSQVKTESDKNGPREYYTLYLQLEMVISSKNK